MTIGMTYSLQGMQRAEAQLNQLAQSVAQNRPGRGATRST
jgi:hypothetical protein